MTGRTESTGQQLDKRYFRGSRSVCQVKMCSNFANALLKVFGDGIGRGESARHAGVIVHDRSVRALNHQLRAKRADHLEPVAHIQH